MEINTTTTTTEDQTMVLYMHQCFLCTIRGLLSLFSQMRSEKILLMCCFTVGRLMAELYVGDDIAVHRFRKSCREMFERPTKEMPVIGIAPPKDTNTASISASR